MVKQRFLYQSALLVLLATAFSTSTAWAQAVPNPGERVESLVTFGAQSDKQWGDDDFSQTFFFSSPKSNAPRSTSGYLTPTTGAKTTT